ncbi:MULTISPECIES: antitoxin of toxin-antitoxin stability system [Paracoccus]|uniref:Antitoxin of toxin-antitoxin stability system n=1 Tax=Paracoccus shanxieyensis TaxID=2675752 RepID=A0A6L6J578_9RHOB|nr:antitoxin of toxin-antitoxin stability system [Paracoccus shanxieyensis]MTH66522.1 antitoxin of toxin-antitoxin stability system [Paracoccus shanxieyensis]MTH89740.1 antitoxin of toxin-antitoxin stability system [Paracoccus shanxieyensis]
MPSIIEITVYHFDELPEAGKDNARAWYREGAFDHDWYGAVYEDFQRIAEILGIRLRTRASRLMGGGTSESPCIWFTGFWSQGDGAAWEGSYSFSKGACSAIRSYAPRDEELHRIADALLAIQRRNFYQLQAEVRHRGNYYHAFTMDISVTRESPVGQDLTEGAESAVIDLLRDLARWLYRQLEQEYDYLSSDAAVDEALLANGYTFTESGRRA